MFLSDPLTFQNFNPRTSCEVRHDLFHMVHIPNCISIHAPRVRCDPFSKYHCAFPRNFNPRTSCEVRPVRSQLEVLASLISIHAPRVRCDSHTDFHSCFLKPISIHAPRVRCDFYLFFNILLHFLFQSTHLV